MSTSDQEAASSEVTWPGQPGYPQDIPTMFSPEEAESQESITAELRQQVNRQQTQINEMLEGFKAMQAFIIGKSEAVPPPTPSTFTTFHRQSEPAEFKLHPIAPTKLTGDGDKISAHDWAEVMAGYCAGFGLITIRQGQQLVLTCTEGEATTVANDFIRGDPSIDAATLIGKLAKEFDDKGPPFKRMQILNTCYMSKFKTVQAFIRAFKRAVRQAPIQVSEMHQLYHFVAMLTEEYQAVVAPQNPKTLQQAIELVEVLQATKKTKASSTRTSRTSRNNVCYNCDKPGHMASQCKAACENCGKTGHARRECKSRKASVNATATEDATSEIQPTMDFPLEGLH